MNAARITAILLFFTMAACDLDGCFRGQTITVIFREGTAIHERGKLLKGEDLIGYIEKVGPDKDGQRILMRINMATTIHEHDRFIPYQDLEGVVGLQIEHRGGIAVEPGATIYFPPLEAKPVIEEKTTPVASMLTPPEDPSHNPYEAHTGLDESDEVISFLDDTYARRSIQRSLSLVREAPDLPPEVNQRILAILGDTKRPGTDQEVLRKAGTELPDLRKTLTISARDAMQRGDREAAQQALDAVRQIGVLEQRVEMLRRNPPLPAKARE